MTYVLANDACNCGCVLTCCCPGTGINKTLFATINWTPTGLCPVGACGPPVHITLTWNAAGTGPLGGTFVTQAYWFGCVMCSVDHGFSLVFYCVNSPTCTWSLGSNCNAGLTCPFGPSFTGTNVTVTCNPFSVGPISDASCCGAAAGTTITITT